MHKRFQPHFSAEQISHMTETANALGEGLAGKSDRDVWIWCSNARNEIVDECCSPVTDLKNLRVELDAIDHVLGIVEHRRAEIRAAMIPSGQRYIR